MKTEFKNMKESKDKTKMPTRYDFSELIHLEKTIKNLDFVVPWQLSNVKKEFGTVK